MRLLLAILILDFAFAGSAMAAGMLRAVALSDESFSSFPVSPAGPRLFTPAITGDGRAVFAVATPSDNAPGATHLFRETAAGLEVVLQRGDVLPGPGAGSFSVISPLVSTKASDDLAFRVYSPTSVVTAGSAGFSANDFPEFTIPEQVLQLNAVGQVAIGSAITRFAEVRLFLQTPGEEPYVLGSAVRPQISLDDAGRVSFLTRESRIVLEQSVLVDVFNIAEPDGSVRRVVESGGIIQGRTITGLEGAVLNDRGAAAFTSLVASQSDERLIDAIFIEESDGSFRTAASIGQGAAGAGLGVAFAGLPTIGDVDFNNRGEVLFAADLTGLSVVAGNDQGLWLSGPQGAAQLVMREGMLSPAVLGNVPTLFDAVGSHQLNDQGAVVFTADLKAFNQTQPSLWLRTPEGQLESVLVGGTQLPLQVDGQLEMRTVADIRFAAIEGSLFSQPQALNAAGELAFLAEFTDGTSGVFVWSPVPEPAGVMLAILACGVVLFRRPQHVVGPACG